MNPEFVTRLDLRSFALEGDLHAWTPDPRGRGLWLWTDHGVGVLLDPVYGERRFETRTLPRNTRSRGFLQVAWVDGERVWLARDLDERTRGLGHEAVLWSTSLQQELGSLRWPLGSRVYAMDPEAGLCAVLRGGGAERELCSLEDGRVIFALESAWPIALGRERSLWIAQDNSRTWTLHALDMESLEVRTLATGEQMCRSLTRLASGNVLLGTTHHWLLLDPEGGEVLASRGLDAPPRYWERRLAAHDADVLTLASATALERWHPETLAELEAPLPLQEPLDRNVERAALLGEALVAEAPAGHLRVWCAKTGASLRGRPLSNRRVDTCVCSRDGAYLRLRYYRGALDLEVATGWAPTTPPDWSQVLTRPQGFGIRTAHSPNGRYVCEIREDYEEDGYYSSLDVFHVTLTDVINDVEVYTTTERDTYRDLDVLHVSDAGEVLFRWNRRELVWWSALESTVEHTLACALQGPLYVHEARRLVDMTFRPRRELRVLDADTLEELVSWRVPGVSTMDRDERLLAVSADARWAMVLKARLVMIWDLTTGEHEGITVDDQVSTGCMVPGERRAYVVCERHEIVTLVW